MEKTHFTSRFSLPQDGYICSFNIKCISYQSRMLQCFIISDIYHDIYPFSQNVSHSKRRRHAFTPLSFFPTGKLMPPFENPYTSFDDAHHIMRGMHTSISLTRTPFTTRREDTRRSIQQMWPSDPIGTAGSAQDLIHTAPHTFSEYVKLFFEPCSRIDGWCAMHPTLNPSRSSSLTPRAMLDLRLPQRSNSDNLISTNSYCARRERQEMVEA